MLLVCSSGSVRSLCWKKLSRMQALFWHQQSYYGVDLTPLRDTAFHGYFSQVGLSRRSSEINMLILRVSAR